MTAALLLTVLLGQSGRDAGPLDPEPWEPPGQPFEILRQDAGWCGPRVLFFFACYLGQDCRLEQVVDLCKSDEHGNTTLRDLVSAARDLDLGPVPIACPAEELLALGGPAIICVRGLASADDPREATGDTEAREWPVHFIGLIGPEEEGWFWVVDPAISTQAIVVHGDALQRAYTGHAILLKGCPRPRLQTWWRTFPGILIPAAGVASLMLGLVWVVRNRSGARGTMG